MSLGFGDEFRIKLTQRTVELNKAADAAGEELRKASEFLASEGAPRISVESEEVLREEGSSGSRWTSWRLVYGKRETRWALYLQEEDHQARDFPDENDDRPSCRDSWGAIESDVLSVKRHEIDHCDRAIWIQAVRALPGLLKRLDEEAEKQLRDLKREG